MFSEMQKAAPEDAAFDPADRLQSDATANV